MIGGETDNPSFAFRRLGLELMILRAQGFCDVRQLCRKFIIIDPSFRVVVVDFARRPTVART